MSTKRLPKGLSIKMGHNTVTATLYQTDIVKIDHNLKCIHLRTGGWYTNHTKKCINLVLQDLNIKVIQRKGQWLIMRNSGTVDVKAQVFQNESMILTLD